MSKESLPSTHHQERIQNLAQPFEVLSFFDIRSKPQKRSMRRLTVHFTKLFKPKIFIQRLGTKTAFGVPGSDKFNTEICVVSHIALVQWIAGRRLNSQELIGCGSDGSGWN